MKIRGKSSDLSKIRCLQFSDVRESRSKGNREADCHATNDRLVHGTVQKINKGPGFLELEYPKLSFSIGKYFYL